MICIFSFSIYPFTKDLVPYLRDHRHVSSEEYFLMLEW